MLRLRAAVVLMLLAAALAPFPAAAQDGGVPSHIDPASVYTLEDPRGDAAVEEDDVVGQIPIGDSSFDDVDLVRVRLYEDAGPSGASPPALAIVVEPAGTTNSQTNYTVTFSISKGPRSVPSSTASNRSFTFGIVAGEAATARLSVPLANLGATGGDVLTGLQVSATRTDSGDLPLEQDDQTGTDQAPDAGQSAPEYTFFRPAPVPLVSVQVLSVAGTPGSTLAAADPDEPVDVHLRIANLGIDPVAYGLSLRSTPPLDDPPVFTQELREVAPGASQERNVTVSLAGMQGTVQLTFVVSVGGREFTATATATVAPPPEREVRPAGLDFLTPAAQAVAFDDAFGGYGELALLALLVLAFILLVYLLCALAPSTLAGAGEPSAPPLAREEAPRGVLPQAAPAAAASAAAAREAPPGKPARKSRAAADDDAVAGEAAAPRAAAPAAASAIRIDGVTHVPDAPEEGEPVATEVVLRNDGPGRPVRVVLAVDGADADEAALTVPARATKTVRLTWTAGAGENHVRVRVLPG